MDGTINCTSSQSVAWKFQRMRLGDLQLRNDGGGLTGNLENENPTGGGTTFLKMEAGHWTRICIRS